MNISRKAAFVLTCLLLSASLPAAAQETLRISKIDPPNWWARMPKPMLLVRGQGLSGATFTLSDKALSIERTEFSANGHWAFLWLAASPAVAETVTLHATAGAQRLDVPYTFSARRAAGDGFAGFSARDVMYLIMTDRFADGDSTNDGRLATSSAASAEASAERANPHGWHGGDLRGIAQHLDYLQQLGVTTVWMTPVYENHEADSYHGYGATDLYRVDEHYGTLADLQALGNALHARGMKMVLDEVPNHIGPAHPWVQDEPMPDWFHGTPAHHLSATFNFETLISPHAPRRDKESILTGWFADILPDMNTENEAVAAYLRQNAIWWVEESGADGIRIDTFPFIDRPFWKPYLSTLHGLYPRLAEVGEIKDTNPLITSAYAGGVTRSGVDTALWTPFDFPLDGALHKAFAEGGPLTGIANVLAQDSLYPHPERLVTLLDNHDERRFRTDAKSDAALRLALGVLLTTRGLPQLYAGDELATLGGDDPDNRRDMPGGFPGDPRSVFTLAGRTGGERDMHDWVETLTTLRRAHPSLACGTQQMLLASANTLVYSREANTPQCSGNERTLIAVQRGEAATYTLQTAETALQGCSALHVDQGRAAAIAGAAVGQIHLSLAADEMVVAHCEER